MDSMFAYIGIGAALYSLWSLISMKTKRKIDSAIILPKTMQVTQCRDLDGFIAEMTPPMILLTAGLIIYAICESIHAFVSPLGIAELVINGVMVVVLFIYANRNRHLTKKYFGK